LCEGSLAVAEVEMIYADIVEMSADEIEVVDNVSFDLAGSRVA
jgi:hypothetical protein